MINVYIANINLFTCTEVNFNGINILLTLILVLISKNSTFQANKF